MGIFGQLFSAVAIATLQGLKAGLEEAEILYLGEDMFRPASLVSRHNIAIALIFLDG